MERKLYRSEKDRMIAGVCGGLAEYFNTSPVLVRLIFVLAVFVSLIGVVAYIVLWLLAPTASKAGLSSNDSVKENLNEIRDKATESGIKMKEYIMGKENKENEQKKPEDNEQKPS